MGVNMLKCLLRPKLAISRHFGDPPSTHVRAYGSLVNAPAVFYPSRRMSPPWIAVRPTPAQERNVLIIHKAKCAKRSPVDYGEFRGHNNSFSWV